MSGVPDPDGPVRDLVPLTQAEATDLFRPWADADVLALAVSGGPDSMALMHFAAACAAAARHRGSPFPRLAVATVDHGLRPGSRFEAEQVVAAAARLELDALLLTWDGEKPGTRLQERARHHRYALLADGARRLGATHLATAHTLDDQAETLMFRMARGSGAAGLAGMRPSTPLDGLRLVRPFLGIAKARLIAACRSNGWTFMVDPGNHDPRFARARWRRLLPPLAVEGLDAARLGILARRLAETDDVIVGASQRALDEACLDPDDPSTYRAARLMQEPAAVLYRIIACLLSDGPQPPVRPGRHAPRLERVEALGMALRKAWEQERPLRRTLHGRLVSYDGGSILTVSAEKPRRPPSSRA